MQPPEKTARRANSRCSAGDISQANRFTSGFNPAFSFVIDAVGDYVSPDTGPSGWDMKLRTMEIMSQAWVDPNAWAYFVAASDGEEKLAPSGADLQGR